MPEPLAIREKFAWDDLWKATHPDDPEGISPPAVDFDTDLVLIGIVPGPNKAAVNKLTLDEKGNVDVNAAGTKMGGPGFGFIYLRVPKEGIKAVNGKALRASMKVKHEKTGVRPNAAMELAGTFVSSITNAGEFASIWHSTAANDGVEKPWDVDFSKEMVLLVRSAGNSLKIDDVTLDTAGDVRVVSETTAIPQRGGPPMGFGYSLLVIDREGVVSVDGKAVAAGTQTRPATAPAK
ncbi:MAG TPA: hypothetical protein VHM90_10625, partial [Phycisphaerae bacterium]|nr:hypothetical protein [Phycisphaerae bacterium]